MLGSNGADNQKQQMIGKLSMPCSLSGLWEARGKRKGEGRREERREDAPGVTWWAVQGDGEGGASIFLNYSFVWIYTQEWDPWIIGQFCL